MLRNRKPFNRGTISRLLRQVLSKKIVILSAAKDLLFLLLLPLFSARKGTHRID
jgi:hypothetical protein